MIVQEWLPGAREAVSLFRAHGRVWARFAQVARRTTPPLGGNSVVRESIPLPADIAGNAERLVDRLDLDGYAEVEFRRGADGRAALMEINPRLSASVEVAVQSGVSFPRLLYRWAAGEELEPVDDYRVGVRARWLGGDLSWLKHCLAWPDDPDAPSRPKAIAQFAAEFLRPATYDYVTGGDLRPAAVAAVGKLRAARRVRGVARSTHGGRDTDVAVIGAGPYGLSVAAHLAHTGISHEIFGEPMSTSAPPHAGRDVPQVRGVRLESLRPPARSTRWRGTALSSTSSTGTSGYRSGLTRSPVTAAGSRSGSYRGCAAVW